MYVDIAVIKWSMFNVLSLLVTVERMTLIWEDSTFLMPLWESCYRKEHLKYTYFKIILKVDYLHFFFGSDFILRSIMVLVIVMCFGILVCRFLLIEGFFPFTVCMFSLSLPPFLSFTFVVSIWVPGTLSLWLNLKVLVLSSHPAIGSPGPAAWLSLPFSVTEDF